MTKKEIATCQIVAAANHYSNGEYICSITLAGAAEEILGKISKSSIGFNELEKDVEYLRNLYHYFSGRKPKNKELIQKINKVKNELKHNKGGNSWVEANFEYEAAIIFVKAMKNHYNSFGEFPADVESRLLFEHLTL